MTKLLNRLVGLFWFHGLLLYMTIKKKPVSLRWPQQKWILGHRGARAIAPENTLSSFRKAMESGADGVEFDVMLSKDSVPMIIHDDSLERTTNGIGLVADYAAKELEALDATKLKPGFKKEGVPTLAETLQELPDGTITNIELKNAGHSTRLALVESVLAVAKKHESRLIIIISSFDGALLSLFRAQAPDYLISLLLSPRDHFWPWSLAYWQKIKPDALHLPPELATTMILSLARSAQIPIGVWTVNDPQTAQWYFSHGVSGVFTDKVAEVVGNSR